ncbi:MAG: polyphenol oxidase family protein, partial [Rhodospirillaceae bacterium]|nr:polyphenol oxidase family protein [Rhodospirillaceae bacterium]
MNTNIPVRTISHPLLEGEPSVVHGFFTRDGGVSGGIYSGLNCGPGSNDAPENVKTNRQLAIDALSSGGGHLFTCYQVHSSDVITLNENWRDDFSSAQPKADAMVSKASGVVLGILTADCSPVLLADTKNKVIGALHAGWKGAVAGIVGNTVKAMAALGADPATTVAVI